MYSGAEIGRFNISTVTVFKEINLQIIFMMAVFSFTDCTAVLMSLEGSAVHICNESALFGLGT